MSRRGGLVGVWGERCLIQPKVALRWRAARNGVVLRGPAALEIRFPAHREAPSEDWHEECLLKKVMKAWWWRILLGAAFLVVPGSLLLLPLVLAVLQRQRAAQQLDLVPAATPEEPRMWVG